MAEHGFTTLVGDIGGSNARFGLVAEGAPTPGHVAGSSIDEHGSLADALDAYLQQFPDIRLRRACLAIATPIGGDTIRLTNSGWTFSIEQLRRRLHLDVLKVINDFTALALSIPGLSAEQLHQVGGGAPVANSAIAVIGPGTGLGVSGLVPTRGGWIPLEGEGGHVTIGATTHREFVLFRTLWDRFGHMSAERLLSGMAMADVYNTLCSLDGKRPEALSPQEITARATEGICSVCMEVMELFYGWLGLVSGNLALTLGARGGVYVGGGIVPRLLEPLQRSGFRRRFEERGRFCEYLKAIPVFVITAREPALNGAVLALDSSYDHIGITRTGDK